MSCDCQISPCSCDSGLTVCDTEKATLCDLYVQGEDNVWVEKGCNPGDENAVGVCMLDTMCESQVIHVLERDDKARADLLKVTSDPYLLKLAKTVKRLPTVRQTDAEQALINQPNNSGSIPFYSQFRGRIPFVS